MPKYNNVSVEQFHFKLNRIRLQYVSYTHITNMFRLIYIRFRMKNCSNKQNRVGKIFCNVSRVYACKREGYYNESHLQQMRTD